MIVTREFDFDTAVIAQLLNNSMRDENDKKIKNINREILDLSATNENFDLSESKFKAIFRDVKRNAHIERSFSDSQDSVDEKIENVELINVNESRTVKFKNRSKSSKNEKSLMTRANKTAIKSTRRNFSEFEYVEVAVEAFQEREREVRKRESREERNAREREAREEREEREERDEHVVELTVDQKLQAIKNEALTNKAKRQQKMNQLNENIKTIEETNIVIKKSVRALYSSE